MKQRGAIFLGSLWLAATAYAFLVVAARNLAPEDYAALAALWAMVFGLPAALFMPLEQEVARQLTRRDDGAPALPQLLRASVVAAVVGVVLAVALLLPWLPLLRTRAFDGSGLLLLGLVLALVGYALTHLVRGLLLGSGGLVLYGVSLGAEGTVRLLGAVALAALVVDGPGPYGLVLGAVPLLVALVLLRPARDRAARLPSRPSGTLPLGGMLPSLAALVVASVLSLGLINGGPVVVKLLAGPGDGGDAGRLLAALALARLPLFAFPTLQAVLLPRFVHLTGTAGRDGLGRLLRRLAAWHVGATLVGAALAAVLGPATLALVFGDAYRTDALDVVLLTVGAAGHLLALLMGLALLASGRSSALALAWAAAVAVAAVTVAVVDPLLLRVEAGLVVGSWTAVLLIAAALLRPRSPQPAAPRAVAGSPLS